MRNIIEILKESKATTLILTINLIIFVLILANGGFNSTNLVRFGASNSELIKEGQYYRLLTSLFIHHSWIHFIFNMFVIYMIAPSIESRFGPWVLLGVFLLAGLFDDLFSFLISDNWQSAGGSSTGFFGLYGLAIGTLLFYKDQNLNQWAKQFILPMVIIFIASEIYFRITAGRPDFIIEFSQGHLTAFVAGVILAGVFAPRGYYLDKKIRIICGILFIGLLLLFLFFGFLPKVKTKL